MVMEFDDSEDERKPSRSEMKIVMAWRSGGLMDTSWDHEGAQQKVNETRTRNGKRWCP